MTKAQLELLLAIADCSMHSQRVKDAVCEVKYERGVTKMINTAQWIMNLEGLSDQPLLRAAQIALAAIDEIITADVLNDNTAAVAAYDALQTAIANTDR